MKDNNGITLIVLTITIIIVLIISGIAITGGNESLKMTKTNKLISELDIVQHACLERYSEYKLTKDDSLLVGEEISYDEVEEIAYNMGGATIPNGNYYKIEGENLSELGLTAKEPDTYIVNYEYGVVLNYTTPQASTGEYLIKINQ